LLREVTGRDDKGIGRIREVQFGCAPPVGKSQFHEAFGSQVRKSHRMHVPANQISKVLKNCGQSQDCPFLAYIQ
jgi:hypothetical protein